MEYFRLTESSTLPALQQLAPFKAVLAIEDNVSYARQCEVSSWLVEIGGRYVMLCGEGCKSWQETIRQANLDRVNLEDMKPEEFVMITMHVHEKLRSVFWHAKKHARHSHVKFGDTVTIHIGNQDRSVEYLSMYSKI